MSRLEELLNNQRNKLKSKADFEDFLQLFLDDFKENSGNWENANMVDFIEALLAYTKDIEGYYLNLKVEYNFENPTWKMFADILLGAKIYE